MIQCKSFGLQLILGCVHLEKTLDWDGGKITERGVLLFICNVRRIATVNHNPEGDIPMIGKQDLFFTKLPVVLSVAILKSLALPRNRANLFTKLTVWEAVCHTDPLNL
jgi:hypothetical protein